MTTLTPEEMRVKIAEAMGIDTNAFRWNIRYWTKDGETQGIAQGFATSEDAYEQGFRLKKMGFEVGGPVGRRITAEDLPDYTSDLNAAFTLVEKLKSEGWEVSMSSHKDGSWGVFLSNAKLGLSPDVCEDSLPLAICTAFLKTLGLL